ncbi:MAG TPA: FCD domain-containing protein [Microlunatus sp.]
MSDQRAWQVVLGRIERDLANGVLEPGDHLAPERALAAELGVGRSSVREAVRVLEVLGLLRTQTGSGPTSGAVITAAPSDGMSVLMRLQVAAQGFRVDDVVRTRLLLETAVIGELAELRTADLTEADALLLAMDDRSRTSAEFLALDAQFHLALATAAGNQVVIATMAGLRTSIEGYVLAGAAQLSDWTPVADRLRAEHRAIVASVRAHDPAAARRQLDAHITGYYAETFHPHGSTPSKES